MPLPYPIQASHLPSAPAGGFRRKISKKKARARCIEEKKNVKGKQQASRRFDNISGKKKNKTTHL